MPAGEFVWFYSGCENTFLRINTWPPASWINYCSLHCDARKSLDVGWRMWYYPLDPNFHPSIEIFRYFFLWFWASRLSGQDSCGMNYSTIKICTLVATNTFSEQERHSHLPENWNGSEKFHPMVGVTVHQTLLFCCLTLLFLRGSN